MKNSAPRIAELWAYPVKSCAGIRLTTAALADYGISGDRMFMVVNEAGEHITQRDFPALAVVQTDLRGDFLTLRAEGMRELLLPLDDEPEQTLAISVWGHHSPAHDAGNAAAEWFSAYLSANLRLVRIGSAFRRTVDSGIITFRREVSFVDSYPLMTLSRATLAFLNERLSVPVPMNRFRPNIVVENAAPFAEDSWRVIRAGGSELHFGKQCGRCVVPNIDQKTGRPDGKEPLQTLSMFRRASGGKVVFGAYFAHVRPGDVLREGDEILVERTEVDK